MDSFNREVGVAHTSPPNALPVPLFILGVPRSFTSVVSTMVGRHPQLYGLPETHLFGYETLAEWWRGAAEANWPLNHGLLRAVAELHFGGQTETTVRRASGWLRRRLHLTTGAVLEGLAERVYPRILVEKSPSIAWNVESMRRAYAMFPQARFIHLIRHPRSHGESVLKALAWKRKEWKEKLGRPLPSSHWVLLLCTFPPPPPSPGEDTEVTPAVEECLDPQWSWYALNRNILEFLADVPAARVLRIRGEELLTDPDVALPALAVWLGLGDDPESIEEMKHPEHSPYACFGPPGAQVGNDVFFLQNPRLRPDRAEPRRLEGPLSWRMDGRGFASEVRQLALEFGYT